LLITKKNQQKKRAEQENIRQWVVRSSPYCAWCTTQNCGGTSEPKV